MEKYIHFLLKFGNHDHIIDLQKNGTIYMNTLSYFKNIEKEKERGDYYEGMDSIKQLKMIKIKVGEKIMIFDKDGEKDILQSAQLYESPEFISGNIYSLYAITSEANSETHVVDLRLSEFGDSFLVITDALQFLKRIVTSIKELNLNHHLNYLTYYDAETSNGDLGYFFKKDIFKHQNELRLLVDNNVDRTISFQIGSIENISSFHKISDLPNLAFICNR